MKPKSDEYRGDIEAPGTVIQKRIVEMIENGELLPGEKLYSERTLANMYGISRTAVQNAFNALARKGYLARVRGSGTFVRGRALDKMDLRYASERGNTGITALAKNHGARISSKVLTRGVVTGNFFSRKLGLAAGESVYVLHRIRRSNDGPVAVEYTCVPAGLFPDMDEIDFENVSLYDYMDSKNRMPVKFMQKLQLIEATEKEREYLELDKNEPLYYFEFTGCDETGTIVEYTESYTRCDKFVYRFDATV